MKICRNMCPQTFDRAQSNVTSCMNGVTRVIRVITFPIRLIANNQGTTCAVVIGGAAIYLNPGLLRYVAGGAGFVSFLVSMIFGNAASFMHTSGQEIEYFKDVGITKKTCVLTAAIATGVTTLSFTSIIIADSNPVSTVQKIKLALGFISFLNITLWTIPGAIFGYCTRRCGYN